MTSDDVVQSLERARTHPESVSPVLLDSVSRVVAEGRYTIRIELKKPDAVLLKKLVSIAIVPGGAPHRIFEPVGTGPYRVVDSDPGKSLSLEAFADYWGEASGQEHIKVFFEEDQGASLELLRSKKADLVVGLRPELVEEVEKSPDLWVESTLGALVHVLGLNAHQPPFDDPVVREAIDEALDRNGLAEDVFLKYCRPAGQLVNQMAYGFSPDIDAVERNLTRARALLLAAPSDSPISFTLEFREGSEVLADTIKRQLSEAGVQVVLQPRPWSELLPRLLEGEVQAGLFTWRNSQMDVGFLFDIALHSKSPIHAKLGYSSPETDRLVVACQTTLDPSARLELLYSIAGRVAHDRVLLPLVWGLDLYGVRRDIEWTPPPSGVIDLRTISRRSPS